MIFQITERIQLEIFDNEYSFTIDNLREYSGQYDNHDIKLIIEHLYSELVEISSDYFMLIDAIKTFKG